jgi:hypothetical protein
MGRKFVSESSKDYKYTWELKGAKFDRVNTGIFFYHLDNLKSFSKSHVSWNEFWSSTPKEFLKRSLEIRYAEEDIINMLICKHPEMLNLMSPGWNM